MSDKILYWSSVIFSAAALLLFMTNTTFINANRLLQSEVSNRQNTINRAVNMTQLNQNMAQVLAAVVVNKQDKEISELLSSQGISVRKGDAVRNKPASEEAKK